MNIPDKAFVTQILQDLLQEKPNFLCFTDHTRLNILSWKSKKIPQANLLKIGDQRFIGFLRKDRNGEDYWKYQPLDKPESSNEAAC